MSYTLKQNCICSSEVPACVKRSRIRLAPLFVMLKIVITIKTDNPLIHSSLLRETSAPEENAWKKYYYDSFFCLLWKSWGDDLLTLEQHPLIGFYLIVCFFQFALKILKWRLQSVIWKQVKRISTNSSYTKWLSNWFQMFEKTLLYLAHCCAIFLWCLGGEIW